MKVLFMLMFGIFSFVFSQTPPSLQLQPPAEQHTEALSSPAPETPTPIHLENKFTTDTKHTKPEKINAEKKEKVENALESLGGQFKSMYRHVNVREKQPSLSIDNIQQQNNLQQKLDVLQLLNRQQTDKIHLQQKSGVPAFVKLAERSPLSKPATTEKAKETRVLDFIAGNKTLFRLADPSRELKKWRSCADPQGYSHLYPKFLK